MLVLVLDTSTPAVTAAVAAVDRAGSTVLATSVTVDPRRHGELLAPSVRDVLARAGAGAGALGAVVAGLGPGPFTGLRVGLVTAEALADALGLPRYGVCSLDAVAFRAPGVTAPLLVATDARRREVYWAVRDVGGRRIAGPDVGTPAEVGLRAARLGAGAMAGPGAAMYADVLGLPLVADGFPEPAGLAALAAGRVLDGAPSEPLTPLYLRRPDATPPGAVKRVSAR